METGADTSDGGATGQPQSLFEYALAVTEGLPGRTAQAFGGIRFLYSPVLGMLYNVAQRLIDAKSRGAPPSATDEALILTCNRLFNESFAGYVALTQGLLGPGHHHLRAALEVTNLGILFILRPEHAEPWLAGKEYSPGRVRALIDSSDEARAWYSRLSKLTHANASASGSSVVRLDETTRSDALFYGGYYAPRAMASSCLAFVWLGLTFLRTFYGHNEDRLSELGLLWHPSLDLQELGDADVTWEKFLNVISDVAESVQQEVLGMPDDEVTTPEWASEILRSSSPAPPDFR